MAIRVVIVGGGVAAFEAALALRALAEDRVSVEMLAPEPQFWYRPLAVAEPFGLGEVKRFDVAELAARAGADYSPEAVVAIETGNRQVRTSTGSSIAYDTVLVACGAVPTPAVPGAITFRGPGDVPWIGELLGKLDAGEIRRVAFTVPWGAVWSLPMYELSLLTASHVEEHRLDVELAVVTPEEEPLQIFGRAASEAVRRLLDERGVVLHTGSCAIEAVEDELRIIPEGRIPADRIVALPRLRGPRIEGLPQTVEGFLPTDGHGRVRGFTDVFAAGDITSFPVKQGGIATQQADAAAQMIAAVAGAEITPEPFRPVLRGLLLTGRQPRYLRHEITGGAGDTSAASLEPLWWPPAKIVGRYFGPFMAAAAGPEVPAEMTPPAESVQIDRELAAEAVDRLGRPPLELAPDADEEVTEVAAVMSSDHLVVAPEDTLGEVAEKLRAGDLGSALVVDFGRLIGIVTSRDMLSAVAGRVHPSEARVREWMTAEPVAVSPTTPIETAVTLMTEYGLHRLPVVDEDELPTGMIELSQAARKVGTQTAIGLGF